MYGLSRASPSLRTRPHSTFRVNTKDSINVPWGAMLGPVPDPAVPFGPDANISAARLISSCEISHLSAA